MSDEAPTNCKHLSVMHNYGLTDEQWFKLSPRAVRERYPRFEGRCPDCNQLVIVYDGWPHYIAGDY